MGIFRKDVSVLIQKLESNDLHIPNEWLWWDKRLEHFHEIEETDIEIIRRIRELNRRGKIKPELAKRIVILAMELKRDLEVMLRQMSADAATQKKGASIANRLIDELKELLEKTDLRYRIVKGKLHLSNELYQIEKTKENGEREILDLTLHASKEGAWVYSVDKNCWFNLCKDWSKGDQFIGTGVMINTQNMGIFGQSVSVYHCHPALIERQHYSTLTRLAKMAGVFGATERYKNVSAATISIPHPGDVKTSIDILNNSRGCKVDFKIVSPHGILTYEITSATLTLGFLSRDYENSYRNIFGNPQEKLLPLKSVNDAISAVIAELNYSFRGAISMQMMYV